MSVIESSIEGHDQYFSRVITWISSELYHVKEQEESAENDRYYKHKKQPLPEAQKKLLRKKRRKDTYAPGNDGAEGEDEGLGGGMTPKLVTPSDASYRASISGDVGALDMLRQRLKQRIMGLKETRTSKKVKPAGGNKKVKKANNKEAGERERSNSVAMSHSDATKEISDSHKHMSSSSKMYDEMDEAADMDMDVAFSDIRGVGGEKAAKGGPGKPGSKTVRLKRMIDEAEKKRKRLDDLKMQGESGKKRVREEQWGEMMREAAGERINVDVGKIKKALKRREKSKEKSADKWNERTAGIESAKQTRIDKRENNLEQRQGKGKAVNPDEKADKPMTSPRGGFEGKKTNLLNGGA
jgi:hypothetical protein